MLGRQFFHAPPASSPGDTPLPDPIDRISVALADRYRIERELGQGGMATVYLAEDLKHKRKVAVKVLKPELAAVLGAERFVQEITTTASLQHPHILPLFDSGTADGFLFYVMPFIQGETLRDKLNRETQLGVDEAVKIATDVADALHYAHTQGVIHRDIKPENILLANGRPMVADFGIALAVSAAAGGRMTETGLSLGTPHYMSPEQATADKEISARSDVYSLGSVLYEMLAGQPPHLGGSAQQIIMKIITEHAQAITTLRKSVPPHVASAFAEALRNPAFTFGAAGAAEAQRPRAMWSRPTIAFAALAGVLAIALAATLLARPDALVAPVMRFALADDDSLRIETGSTRPFAVSPDGQTIVFRAERDTSGVQLWVRTLGDPRARPLAGTTDGMNPTFSPDGEWVAFITDNRNIRKVRVRGGAVTHVALSPSRVAALTWGEGDEIYFEQLGEPAFGIHRVRVNSGTPELAVPLDTANNELSQRRPLMLRGGVIAYASLAAGNDDATLVLYRISDGERARTELPGIGALALIDDLLVYSRADGAVMAVKLNLGAMRAIGTPVPLEVRALASTAGTAAGLSDRGTFVYAPADEAGGSAIALVDTMGVVRPLRGRYLLQTPLRLSPHGRYVAIRADDTDRQPARVSTAAPTYEVRVLDLTTQIVTPLRTLGSSLRVSWTPDGERLVTSTSLGDSSDLLVLPLDGTPETRMARVGATIMGAAFPAPDGKSYVMGVTLKQPAGSAILRVWVDGSGKVDTLLTRSGEINAFMTRLSPDGKLVTYYDRTTGAVYVVPVTGGRGLQVSETPAGFLRPVVWSPDSRRLHYVGPNGLNTIQLEVTPTLRVVGRSVKAWYTSARFYDLLPDGKTYVMENPLERGAGVHAAVNYADEVRRLWAAAQR